VYTNAALDPKLFKAHMKLVERNERNAELMRRAEFAAEFDRDTHQDNQNVEVITAADRALGVDKKGHALSGAGQYSLDPYNKEKVRKLASSPRAKPKQYVIHESDTLMVDGSVIPAGTLEKEFEEVHLEQIGKGERCQRCEDLQPETAYEHKRLLRRLGEATGFEVPAGLKWFDVCCYCGGKLHAKAPGGNR
jgi:hypothetical protein